MGKLIDAKSLPATSSQLLLFEVPSTQVAYNTAQWLTFPTVTPVNNTGPFEFHLADSRHYLQISKCYVSFRIRVKTVKATDNVAVVNYLGGSFFNQVKVELNNTLIFDAPHYGFKAYLEALLNNSRDAKEGIMQAAGYYEDRPKKEGIDNATNSGYTTRLQLAKQDTIDIYAPLHIDPFNTDRLLVPHVNLQIRLFRAPDSFVLVSHEAAPPVGTIELLGMNLHVRAVDVISSASLALERTLISTTAKYPYRRTRVKMLTIPAGQQELPFSTVFTDIIPRRLVIGCVEQKAAVGDISKTPFNFQHFNISEISVNAAGVTYPSSPVFTDFPNSNYANAFVSFFENIGCVSENRPLPISYFDYGHGFTLFAFNLSPSDNNSEYELVQQGSTQIRARFSSPTSTAIQMIIYAEEDALLILDHYRNVYSDRQA